MCSLVQFYSFFFRIEINQHFTAYLAKHFLCRSVLIFCDNIGKYNTSSQDAEVSSGGTLFELFSGFPTVFLEN